MKIAARYIGPQSVLLNKATGPYKDGEGKPLQSLLLHPGDSLMVEEEEITGCTWLHDPRKENNSEKIGLGRVVKTEHAHLSLQEQIALGYQFHDPNGWWAYLQAPVVTAQSQDASVK